MFEELLDKQSQYVAMVTTGVSRQNAEFWGGVIIGSFSNGDGSENVPIKEFASRFLQTLLRLL